MNPFFFHVILLHKREKSPEPRAKKGFTRRGSLFVRVLRVLHVTSVYTRVARCHFKRSQ
jgi:hypothetical protein